MQCEVLRPFQATNQDTVVTGQIVETAGWRDENVTRLIAQRYLRPLEAEAETSQGIMNQPRPVPAALERARTPSSRRR